jgi:hypothetical protein
MKRLNPETGKPFRHGDERNDGFLFRGYNKNFVRSNGTYAETWIHPDHFERRRLKRLSHSEFLASYKLARGCMCCGYNEHACALDFDHIDPKKKLVGIAEMSSYSRAKVIEEISKCIILCARCHRVKTLDPKAFLVLMEMYNEVPVGELLDEADLEYLHGH